MDGLINYVSRIGADVIAEPLHHIITLSIMQESFPEAWKCSKVVPIFKKDDEKLAQNYRPVFILSPL